ncbi:hypothetical protein EV182_008007, partial [Spiromyces aspiralis]
MCLDYFNLKDGTKPPDSPKTSVRVELIESFNKNAIQEDTPQCFDEDTDVITVHIAETNLESPTKKPTLNEFMTKAYYYGYLSIIKKNYLAIPNREMLAFWAGLIINKPSGPGGSPLLRSSKKLTEFLMSGDLGGFCDALEQHFLDHMIKADVGAR